MISKPDNYVSPDDIKDEVIVRGANLTWHSFQRLQPSGKIAVRVLQGLEKQIIPHQKSFQNNIRKLVASHQAKQLSCGLMLLAGFILPFVYSWWFLLLIVVASLLFRNNEAKLQKQFEYALWTDMFFYKDCLDFLNEAFVFSVEKDFKKDVVEEYDAI